MSVLQEFFKTEGFITHGDSAYPARFYSDAATEYDILMHGVGIRDLSDHALLKVTGKDAQDFLHRISTNDLRSLEQGVATNTIFCNEKGRIIDRVNVVKTEEAIWLFGNRNHDERLKRWLHKYIIMDDVTVQEEKNLTVIQITGPQSESFMTYKFGEGILSLSEDTFGEFEWEGKFFLIIKFDLPDFGAFYKITGQADSLKKFILDSMQNKFIYQVGLTGEDAYERLRIERGVMSREELNDNFNPHEAGLIKEVSFTKGCYIGQEVIARLDTYDKVQRSLRKVSVDGNLNGSVPVQIIDENGDDAGTITSGYFVESEGKTLGIAYIRKRYLDSVEKLFIRAGGIEMPVRFRNY